MESMTRLKEQIDNLEEPVSNIKEIEIIDQLKEEFEKHRWNRKEEPETSLEEFRKILWDFRDVQIDKLHEAHHHNLNNWIKRTEKEMTEEYREKYEGNTYANGEYTFTVTDIYVGNGAGFDFNQIVATQEWHDGYVANPPIENLERFVENYDQVNDQEEPQAFNVDITVELEEATEEEVKAYVEQALQNHSELNPVLVQKVVEVTE